MSAPARWELWKAIHAHYRSAPRASKGRILDEFCRATGYHRKYALRLLNGAPPGAARPRRRRRPATYSGAMIQALRVIWEAAGYPWSVRLKALLPAWLPWARWADETRLAAQAPHSPQDGSLGGHGPGLCRGRSRRPCRQPRRWRVRALPQRHRHSHHLGRDARRAWARRGRRPRGLGGHPPGPPVSLAGHRLRQWLGVHQRPLVSLLPDAGDPIHAGAALQERRQRAH